MATLRPLNYNPPQSCEGRIVVRMSAAPAELFLYIIPTSNPLVFMETIPYGVSFVFISFQLSFFWCYGVNPFVEEMSLQSSKFHSSGFMAATLCGGSYVFTIFQPQILLAYGANPLWWEPYSRIPYSGCYVYNSPASNPPGL